MYLEQLVLEIENSVLSRLESTKPFVVGFQARRALGKVRYVVIYKII